MYGVFALVNAWLPDVFAARASIIAKGGAIVYKKPSFDSTVLGVLAEGKRVIVSKKMYRGAFHKVKLRQGRGFITDIDVKIDGKKSVLEKNMAKSGRSKFMRPLIYDSYLGAYLGTTAFKDEIAVKGSSGSFAGSANVNMFGAKYNTTFLGSFALDLSVLYSPSPPSFYEEISLEAPTGSYLLSEAYILKSLVDFSQRKGSLYIGAGGIVSYVDVSIVRTINGQATSIPVAKAAFGGGFMGGLGYRLGKNWVVKLEVKYIAEEADYTSFAMAFQKRM